MRSGSRSLSATLAGIILVWGGVACSGCVAEDTVVVTLGGETLVLDVADTPDERFEGLQGSPEPPDGGGMLFVWEDEGIRGFAIKEIDYPLDVIFVGADGRVTDILPLSPSGPTEAEPSRPSRWVIEVRAGWAEEHGIGPGDLMTIERDDAQP